MLHVYIHVSNAHYPAALCIALSTNRTPMLSCFSMGAFNTCVDKHSLATALKHLKFYNHEKWIKYSIQSENVIFMIELRKKSKIIHKQCHLLALANLTALLSIWHPSLSVMFANIHRNVSRASHWKCQSFTFVIEMNSILCLWKCLHEIADGNFVATKFIVKVVVLMKKNLSLLQSKSLCLFFVLIC